MPHRRIAWAGCRTAPAYHHMAPTSAPSAELSAWVMGSAGRREAADDEPDRGARQVGHPDRRLVVPAGEVARDLGTHLDDRALVDAEVEPRRLEGHLELS